MDKSLFTPTRGTDSNTDLHSLLKLMLKLNTTVIVVDEYRSDAQYLYVVGAKHTFVYKFYEHKLFDMFVKPYTIEPTPTTHGLGDLVAALCNEFEARITIYNQ